MKEVKRERGKFGKRGKEEAKEAGMCGRDSEGKGKGRNRKDGEKTDRKGQR